MAEKKHKVSIGNCFLYLASHIFSGGGGEGAAIMYTE